ncbi:MAG: hypothetical protein A3G93_13290 [Nitrospinae bacterium RIFCSPLOWO2_12_FULL_45_22]|nr:MAG: hypothetical protein A3G93_13290 [Nitrospinae bacterium RIFCSPLOWO2_12_FULL_45_22]
MTWHAAKSLGDGDFIEIMPDSSDSDPDINIKNLKDNPYPGWTYWGAYRLPRTLSKEELQRRVDNLRKRYGIDPGDPNNISKYTSIWCTYKFEKDKALSTYCWGLVFLLNFDIIYRDKKWVSEAELY